MSRWGHLARENQAGRGRGRSRFKRPSAGFARENETGALKVIVDDWKRDVLREFHAGFVEKQDLVAARLAECPRRARHIGDPTQAAEQAKAREGLAPHG